MNEEKIKKIYNSKIKKLNQHNKLYYEKSAPKITDAEYDRYKSEIITLEKKYKFLKNADSLVKM